MTQKKQFTLKWMLIELTLLAVGIGLMQWALLSKQAGASSLDKLLGVGSLPGAFGCFGALVGGIFQRWWLGFMWGIGVFLGFLLLSILFSPAVRF